MSAIAALFSSINVLFKFQVDEHGSRDHTQRKCEHPPKRVSPGDGLENGVEQIGKKYKKHPDVPETSFVGLVAIENNQGREDAEGSKICPRNSGLES